MSEYIEGFKYQAHKDEGFIVPILGYSIDDDYYALTPEGLMTAKKGFAWDGCSGSIDTETNHRGGKFHDIGCLMVAKGQLPHNKINVVNQIFYNMLIEDGMWRPRAKWHYKAVELHFAGNTKPSRRKVIILNKP